MAKDTLIFQSYRTHDVPIWMTQCMETVQTWAARLGYSYQFLDDEFLTAAPEWMKAKCDSILPLTDYCRLVWARKFLDEGWSRVVWIDADVLIFVPEVFSVESEHRELLSRELIVFYQSEEIIVNRKVNNSVCVFKRESYFLSFYMEGCLNLASSASRLDRLALGTVPLTTIHEVFPINLLKNVGCFTPIMCGAINHDNTRFLRIHRVMFGRQIAAANLAHSFSQAGEDAMYMQVVEKLLNSKGAVVNEP